MRKAILFGWVISAAIACAIPANAQHSIETLLAGVEAETDPDVRAETLELVVATISDSELRGVLDLLAREGSPAAAECRGLLVRRWAESDVAAAAEWVAQLPPGPAYRASLEQVAIAWANQDLAAVTAWLSTLPKGEERDAATLAVAYEAARTAPVPALELAVTLASTRERDDLLVHAVSQWGGVDANSAFAWATKVTDAVLRERLVGGVAIAAAEQDGASAAGLAADGMVGSDEQDRAAVCIVQRWAQRSPQAAARWVSTFPDLPMREASVRNLLKVWMTKDLTSPGRWLDELPGGSLRELASAAYAEALAECRLAPDAASGSVQ